MTCLTDSLLQAASREKEDCIEEEQQQQQQKEEEEEDSGLTKKVGTGVSYAVDKAKRKVSGFWFGCGRAHNIQSVNLSCYI